MPERFESNKVELAYSRIKELVINAQFKPGEQLQITELSEQLDVSVTPVREALTRLLAEDLIVSVPNRGFFCKKLDVDELCALYEFATMVLKHSIARGLRTNGAATHFDEFQFAMAVSRGIASKGTDVFQSYAHQIERLFARIATLSGNPLMVSNIESFNNKSHHIRVMDLATEGQLEIICRAVDELVVQIRSARVDAAMALLDRLLARKLERMPTLAKECLARAYLSDVTGVRVC